MRNRLRSLDRFVRYRRERYDCDEGECKFFRDIKKESWKRRLERENEIREWVWNDILRFLWFDENNG